MRTAERSGRDRTSPGPPSSSHCLTLDHLTLFHMRANREDKSAVRSLSCLHEYEQVSIYEDSWHIIILSVNPTILHLWERGEELLFWAGHLYRNWLNLETMEEELTLTGIGMSISNGRQLSGRRSSRGHLDKTEARLAQICDRHGQGECLSSEMGPKRRCNVI